ncbi:hypothetical protein dsx2_2027 [Desulfovibrio sp. X2]|uniref:hypothetical protein n=1 Tax=Desulfovibrio sp. X2 TaxID=941449 RepID=UPI000358B47C|nr:hypothetical protein [Desulfovibrio sp. X2]EPR43917.1 hypothetical protein dsx2_2027 [Desulfovibrio sp. X2]
MLGVEKRVEAMYGQEVGSLAEEGNSCGTGSTCRGARWLAGLAVVVAVIGLAVISARNADRLGTLETRIAAVEQRVPAVEQRVGGLEAVAGGLRAQALAAAVQEMRNKASMAESQAVTQEQKDILNQVQTLLQKLDTGAKAPAQ